jgi:hypothetical protein
MASALEQVIERLKQMSPERQEAFARLILREIVADEQWMRSAAQAAEWQRQQKQLRQQSASSQAQSPPARGGQAASATVVAVRE